MLAVLGSWSHGIPGLERPQGSPGPILSGKSPDGTRGAGGQGCQVLEKGWQGIFTPLSSAKRHFGVWAGVPCQAAGGRERGQAQWLIKQIIALK